MVVDKKRKGDYRSELGGVEHLRLMDEKMIW